MLIKSILAVSDDYIIGLKDSMPWKIKDDMKIFKQLTSGNTVLLGSTTAYGMILNWPEHIPFLENRDVVIITSNPDNFTKALLDVLIHKKPKLNVDNVRIVAANNMNPLQIINKIQELNLRGDLFIAGGAKIYESFMKYSDEIHITLVETTITSNNDYNPNDLTSLNPNVINDVFSLYPIVKDHKKITQSADNEYNCNYYILSKN